MHLYGLLSSNVIVSRIKGDEETLNCDGDALKCEGKALIGDKETLNTVEIVEFGIFCILWLV